MAQNARANPAPATATAPQQAAGPVKANLFPSDKANLPPILPGPNGFEIQLILRRSGQFSHPMCLAWANDEQTELYITLEKNDSIIKYNLITKALTHVAGDNTGGNADGKLLEAKYSCPMGICVAAPNILYLADYGNNKLIQLNLDKDSSTRLAGTNDTQRGYLDGTAQVAQFACPTDVLWDPKRKVLYATEYYNHSVRVINLGAKLHDATAAEINITTLAGNPHRRKIPTRVALANPTGLCWDLHGKILVADYNGHRVLRLDPETGSLTQLVGDGSYGLADGVGKAAKFHGVSAVATCPDGNIMVVDYSNYAIRMLVPLDPQKLGPYRVVTVARGDLVATPRCIVSRKHNLQPTFYFSGYKMQGLATLTRKYQCDRQTDEELDYCKQVREIQHIESLFDSDVVWKETPGAQGVSLKVLGWLWRIRLPTLMGKPLICSQPVKSAIFDYVYGDFAAKIHERSEELLDEITQVATELGLVRLAWLAQCALSAKKKEDLVESGPPGVHLHRELHKAFASTDTDSEEGQDRIRLDLGPAGTVVAHKSILAARSSYFHGMLLAGFKESQSQDDSKEKKLSLAALAEEMDLSLPLLSHILHIIYLDEIDQARIQDVADLQHLMHLLDFFCVWSAGIAQSISKLAHTSGFLQEVANWLVVYKLSRLHPGLEVLRDQVLALFQSNRKKAYPTLLQEKDQTILNEILLYVLFNTDE